MVSQIKRYILLFGAQQRSQIIDQSDDSQEGVLVGETLIERMCISSLLVGIILCNQKVITFANFDCFCVGNTAPTSHL